MKNNPSVLLIDNYDSFTFNLYQNLSELGAKCKVYRNDKITIKQIMKMNINSIVISPGPGNPDTAGISMEVIHTFSGQIPILGVCLGHQAIAQTFGGRITRARQLMHGKLSEIHHTGKGIFNGITNPFTATRYHSLLVESAFLPSCLEITSTTKDGLIMGIKIKQHKTYGVQFHPESIMTLEGKSILRNFLGELE